MADKQQSVNAMAVAIAGAEIAASKLLVRVGRLFQDVEDFRVGCDLHSMLVAEADAKIAAACASFGDGYRKLYEAHDELSEILKKCDLPQPGPVPQGGGGGGKGAGY